MSVSKLKTELADLKSDMRGTDGVALIQGEASDMLLIGKNGKNTFATVVAAGDDMGKLKRWVDGC